MEVDQRDQTNGLSYYRRQPDRNVSQGHPQHPTMPLSKSFFPTNQSARGNSENSLKEGSVSEPTLQARLFEFYSKHQPSIAPRARVIAKQYEGKEDILNRNLRQTYGVDLNYDESGRSRPPNSDSTHNSESSINIKVDGSKPGTVSAGLPPQARPISLKQFLALLNRKDIIPRSFRLQATGVNFDFSSD